MSPRAWLITVVVVGAMWLAGLWIASTGDSVTWLATLLMLPLVAETAAIALNVAGIAELQAGVVTRSRSKGDGFSPTVFEVQRFAAVCFVIVAVAVVAVAAGLF